MNPRILLLFCLLTFQALKSQTPENSPSPKDTLPAFIRYPDKLTTRTQLTYVGNSFLIRNFSGERFPLPGIDEGTRLRLDPVYSTHLSFVAQFRILELGFGFTPNFLNDKNAEDARQFNLQIKIYPGRWAYEFSFLDQRGFETALDGEDVYFPGVSTSKFQNVLGYVFNPNFSLRALQSPNEWQTRSAGSFIPKGIFSYTRYRFENEGSKNAFNSFDLGLAPGYFYTWVLGKRFLLSAGNNSGIGINLLNQNGETDAYLLWESVFQASLGYNDQRFFAGINGTYSFMEHGAGNEIQVFDRVYFVRISLGYRFDAPKKWNEKADRINQKYGWGPSN
ncbi:MAG: DUF4421 family protein [Robiginitalea sp.]|jgi:hypothetical protein|uniref:DUF4421 family protein n=2 Tax=Robiginitalea sp. TaxID=1902411 RepID=UPI003C767C41